MAVTFPGLPPLEFPCSPRPHLPPQSSRLPVGEHADSRVASESSLPRYGAPRQRVPAALTVLVFGSSYESQSIGVALLVFSAGWLLLATLTHRLTDQPQRWAIVPAAITAGTGACLLILDPGDTTMTVLGGSDRLGCWCWRDGSRARRDVTSGAGAATGCVSGISPDGARRGRRRGSRRTRHSAGDARWRRAGRRRRPPPVPGMQRHGQPDRRAVERFQRTHPSWAWVTPTVSQATPVCVYDPAGIGWSDPSTLRRTATRSPTTYTPCCTTPRFPGRTCWPATPPEVCTI